MATSTITALTAANSIDPVNDYMPIDTANISTTQKINRNTYLGLTSAPVGLNDSQTLTNKVLTSPTISGPTLSGTIIGTYTIGGTPTFPSSVVTLTGSQTLTNKVLTSPTISAPTITNATISADALTGFSASTTGTVYGMSVAAGVLASAAIANAVNTAAIQSGAVGSSQIATNGVAANNLATTALVLGLTQITSNFTTSSTSVVQVTGLTSTVTIPAGGRRTRITAYIPRAQVSAITYFVGSIWDGTVGSGTQLVDSAYYNAAANSGGALVLSAIVSPSAGSKTYNVGAFTLGASTLTVAVGATSPAYILVEAL